MVTGSRILTALSTCSHTADRLAIDFGHDTIGMLLWRGAGWYSVIRLTTLPALVSIPILYVRPLSAFGW
jgi:hypothetical protein